MIKYVAFHNENQIYKDCARQLEDSLVRQGISEYYIKNVGHSGWDFHRATAYKPEFIADCMDRFPNYNIVYLDTDAIVMQYPDLFENIPDTADIGVHYRRNGELLSGTIYLKNTGAVRNLVKAWADKCFDDIRVWDQKVLQSLLEEYTLEVYRLPPTYCQIFDSMASLGEPVIRHMQASRLSRGIDPSHNPCQGSL